MYIYVDTLKLKSNPRRRGSVAEIDTAFNCKNFFLEIDATSESMLQMPIQKLLGSISTSDMDFISASGNMHVYEIACCFKTAETIFL